MRDVLLKELKKRQEVFDVLQKKEALWATFAQVLRLCLEVFSSGGKILIAGNGGSAADAQHWAAELVVRFRCNRSALPAIALSTDSSILTAIGNDFGFEEIFARQIEALGSKGDIFFAITTSGKSPNIHRACRVARQMGLHVVGFTKSESAEDFVELCDFSLGVPAQETAIIQEMHEILGHILCSVLEEQALQGERSAHFGESLR